MSIFATESRSGGPRGVLWRLSAGLARVELALATLGLVAVVLTILLQAGARIGLDLGLSWPGEASRYLYIWCSFLGAAASVHYKEEIRVDVLTPMAERWAGPARAESVVLAAQRFGAFVGACFLVYLAVLGWEQIGFQRDVDTRSVVMGIPLWWVSAAVLVTSITGAFHYVAVALNEPLADELLTKNLPAEVS